MPKPEDEMAKWRRCRAQCSCDHCTELRDVLDGLETGYALQEDAGLVFSSQRFVDKAIALLEAQLAGLILIPLELITTAHAR